MDRNPHLCFIALWLTGILQPLAASDATPVHKQSIAQLEQRLNEIDEELEHLASYTLRSGVGSVGYRSQSYQDPDNREWIRFELDEATVIDQIVLVPMLWRDPHTGVQADGFPESFRILAGTTGTTNIVASFTPEDQLLPRIAPLAVDCPQPLQASWILVEATTLTRGAMQRTYGLQFAEILVFSGNDNIILGHPVSVPNPNIRAGTGRSPASLVDGFFPYLMDAQQGEKGLSIQGRADPKSSIHSFTIDLGKSCLVNQINLHTIDLNHNVPLTHVDGYGVPTSFRVTGANRPDFSDATSLFNYERRTIKDSGPIISRRFPETSCRYIRLSASADSIDNRLIGFSEIEVLCAGNNVSTGKPVSGNGVTHSAGNLSRMTDGHNYYGSILPTRIWMNQLARRHDLETERPLVEARLIDRYARQKAHLNLMYWLAALLAATIGFFVLIERMIHRRQLEKIRTRFAADLHDELGANIHSIGLLTDFADRVIDSPGQLRPYLQRIRKLTERTGTGIRHCTDLLEADQLFSDLKTDMQRCAERIVTELEHQFTVEGDHYLEQLTPRACKDLFLFYKESLININRHADASEINTRLIADEHGIQLIISDNGRGISAPAENRIPSSLKRRAKMLKAKLNVDSVAEGGTTITLRLRRRWRVVKQIGSIPSRQPASDT